MDSIKDEGQTDHVSTPTRAGLHRCCWPLASPRWLAADHVTVETHYYGHQSVLIGRRSKYSCSAHILR